MATTKRKTKKKTTKRRKSGLGSVPKVFTASQVKTIAKKAVNKAIESAFKTKKRKKKAA